MPNVTERQLRQQYAYLSHAKRDAIRAAVRSAPHVDYALALAIGSRETNMRDIVGDGGHGRGFFQIDDRSHYEFLRRVGAGRGTPPFSLAARYAVGLLESNVERAKREGVPIGMRLKVAVAGYNAGMGGALAGWRLTGDPDSRTTGRDYSDDVLARAHILRYRLI